MRPGIEFPVRLLGEEPEKFAISEIGDAAVGLPLA
jgi:hypothetical protein